MSCGDLLGCDRNHQTNEAVGSRAPQRIENHRFHAHEVVSHIDLVRCYPEDGIKSGVRTHVIERILAEISTLQFGRHFTGQSVRFLNSNSRSRLNLSMEPNQIPMLGRELLNFDITPRDGPPPRRTLAWCQERPRKPSFPRKETCSGSAGLLARGQQWFSPAPWRCTGRWSSPGCCRL